MKKRITVENNQVIVTDIATNKKIVVPYHNKYFAAQVVNEFTGQQLCNSDFRFPEDAKEIFRLAGDELGTSAAKFAAMLNGAVYRAYVLPNNELHKRFSLFRTLGNKWIKDVNLINIVNNNCDTIYGYINDNIPHLAGFGLLAIDAFHARKIFGKGLWKRLVHNSATRNDMICKVYVQNYSSNDTTHMYEFIRFLNTVPSTMLKKSPNIALVSAYQIERATGMNDLYNTILRKLNRPMCKIKADDVSHICTIIADAHNMIQRAGGTFNPNWSINRIKREHDAAVVEIAKQGSSTAPFAYNDLLPNGMTDGEFTAELCKSHRELAMLGATEHHCVGSYHESCAEGAYAVYKITDTAERVVSTLGITHPSALTRMDQHHYAFNRRVEDKARNAFANMVKLQIKKIMKKSVVLTQKQVDGTFIF